MNRTLFFSWKKKISIPLSKLTTTRKYFSFHNISKTNAILKTFHCANHLNTTNNSINSIPTNRHRKKLHLPDYLRNRKFFNHPILPFRNSI